MKNNKEKILEEYIQFRGLKNHTDALNDIKFQVNRFIQFKKKSLEDFNQKDLTEYLNTIQSEYSVPTMNWIKSSVLKNFIQWHFQDWSLRFRNLELICKTEKTSETYKPEEMIKETEFQKLIQKEESHFWKAFFMTMFYGGCRPIEVCNLQWKDVEFEEGDNGAYITIYSAKNRKTFTKYLPKDVAFYLKEQQGKNKDWVFFNPDMNAPITRKGAYFRMKRLSKRVLGKELDLKIFRHSIATIIYNKDYLKDDYVANQMGHTKSMKGKYVHNDKDRLKQIAKSIYVNPEGLPPEKKHELEIENERIKKKLAEQDKNMVEIKQQLIEFQKMFNPSDLKNVKLILRGEKK